MTDLKIRDRISGSLYGLLIGDALGCPTEGLTQEEIEALYGAPVTEMVEGARWWRPAGLHSDDGQQAIAILDAVLKDPDRVGEGFASQIVALLTEGPRGYRRFGLHRGTGANFRGTVMKLKQGAPREEAAVVTAGNGAAMRVAPLALYFRDDPDALAEALVDVSLYTHRDTRGIAAAAAVADVVRRAVTHDSGPLETAPTIAFTRAVEDRCAVALELDEVDRGFSEVLSLVLNALPFEDTEALLDAVVEAAAPSAEVPEGGSLGALDGFASASVTASVALFFQALSVGADFEDALVECVNLGGDADTTGAMLGQMLGALYGRDALPRSWMDALWARGVLEDRIDALERRARGFEAGFSLVELELPWTRALYDGQAARKSSGAPPRSASAARVETISPAQKLADAQGKSKRSPDPAPLSPAEEFAAAAAAARADAPAAEPEPEPKTAETVETVEQPTLWALPKPQEKAEAPAVAPMIPDLGGQLGLFGSSPKVRKPEVETAETEPAKPPAVAARVEGIGGAIKLSSGDITTVSVDVIVNAANSALRGGGGVDGAIHRAGGPDIMAECKAIRARQGGCRTGDAVMTTAGELAARHVVHAVGPRWRGGERGEPELLQGAYEASLELARAAGYRTLAFPSISTGSYAYPIKPAARVALTTVARYLAKHPAAFDEVRFILFNQDDLQVYQEAYDEVVGDPNP